MIPIEAIFSITSAFVLAVLVAVRLNLLYVKRTKLNMWHMLEGAGWVLALAGCAGVVGQWFLPPVQFYPETLALTGFAMGAFGGSKGHLIRYATMALEWHGQERRNG